MRVSLLGPVLVELEGWVVDLGPTKQRAVFALLAMSAGRVVPMDRLIDDLWRGEPPARATVTLRAYISRLRRALEKAAQEHGLPVPEIRTQPPGWVLTLSPDQVDLYVFLNRIERARAMIRDGATPDRDALLAASSELESALMLWRGDVLADLHSLDMARAEVARLEDARLSGTELLLETRLRLGQHELVVDEARLFVAEQPYRERAWAALVVALYRCGRQTDAVAAVARLRSLLVDELGLDPSPQVQDLERRVLQQDPGLLLAPLEDVPVLQATAVTPVTTSRTTPVTAGVVGATSTLEVIAHTVDRARAGHGRLLVLEADAGGGKSTMLDELARVAVSAGGRVVHGAGGGAGSMPALWSWVTIVRALAGEDPGARTASMDVAAAITLMGTTGSATAAPQEFTLSRTALYQGVVELLAAAHASTPLTVVIDDLQWVDQETFTLLTLAVDQLAPRGVVFAVAVRTDEPDAEPVLGALARAPARWLLRHRLRGLDEAAVRQLATQLVGAPVDAGVAAQVHRVTAGNPMFVSELVRLLAAEGRLDVMNVTTTVPDRVHDVLRRRFARLPSSVVSLLQVTAVARSAVDVDLLAAVAGSEADQVLDELEPAVIAGLLVEQAGGFALSHELVRQALLVDVSRARRLRLHARIAAAMQSRGGLDPTGVLEVAHHLTEAAPAIGAAAAIPYLVSAAKDAMSRYATLTASSILADALELVAQIADPAQRRLHEHRVRGQLAMVRGYTVTEPDLPAAHEPPPLPVDDASAMAWVGTMTMTMATGQFEWARTVAEEALASRLPPVGRLAASLLVGTTSFALGDVPRSRAAMTEVLALCDQNASDGLTGLFESIPDVAETHVAVLEHLEGDDAAATLRMARARHRPGMSVSGELNVDLFAGLLAAAQGDAERARLLVAHMTRLAEDHEYPVFVVHGRVIGSWAEAMLGRAPDAEHVHAALQSYHEGGLVIFETTYQLLLAEVLLRSGDLAGAREAIERSRWLTSTTGQVPLGPRLQAVAGRVMAADA